MKILLFSPVFFPEVSGMSNHALLLSKHLSNLGADVKVYTITHDEPSVQTIDGLSVHRLRTTEDFFVYDISKQLSTVIEENKPDVVHFHGTLAGLTAILTHKPNGLKFVVTLHTLWDQNRDYHLPDLISDVQKVQNVVLRSSKIDHFIAVSGFVESVAHDYGCSRKKLTTIHNGIDIQAFSNVLGNNEHLGNLINITKSVKLLLLSRISPEKGIVEFVKHFSQILQEYDDIDLIIAGGKNPHDYKSVTYYDELIRTINEYNLQDYVHLIGAIPYQQVPDLLSACDIGVLPSFHEGFSLAIIETMASGKPVVVFNTGGENEMITSGFDGILVERGDYTLLMKEIVNLAANADLRIKIGRNAKNTALNKFSASHMSEKVFQIYQSK